MHFFAHYSKALDCLQSNGVAGVVAASAMVATSTRELVFTVLDNLNCDDRLALCMNL